MRIERLRIRAYRSLYDVTLEPDNFNVLVGPNNSGKSNLVEAIDFLADVHRYGVEVAVTRKGGFDNIAFRRMRRTKQAITFEVSALLSHEETDRYVILGLGEHFQPPTSDWKPRYRVQHTFSIGARGERIDADFTIQEESLTITRLESGREKKERPLVRVTRSGETVEFTRPRPVKPSGSPRRINEVYPFEDAGFQEFAQSSLLPTDTVLKTLEFNSIVRRYRVSLQSTKIYQLAPIECRRPGVSMPNADIDIHGQNLPALVAFMRQHHREAWDSVMNAMRAIVPDLSEVDTSFTHDRRLYLRFYEEGTGRPWTSEDISDGTIQSLALFTALFDPRSQFVLVEEPENSVHPWIVRTFVDACRSVPNKQLIITSHSPALMSQLHPAEVSLAWRKEGRTNIATLVQHDPDSEALWASGEGSVFDLLNSGLITAAIPGGLQ
jgi:predicted ATPase